MKIVITFVPNDHIANGINQTLCGINTDTKIWIPETKQIYDVLYEEKPELIFIHGHYINNTILQFIREFNLPYVILGKSLLPTPNALTIYDNLTPQANILQYRSGRYNPLYESDVLYISNQSLTQEIVTILSKLDNSDLKLKICGPLPIQLISYVGMASISEISDIIESTKIILDINQNSMYDADINHIFCLSNIQDNPNRETYNLSNFMEIITKYVQSQNLRDVNKRVQPRPTTYLHTWLTIFTTIYKTTLDEKYNLLINKTTELINKL